MLHAHLLASAGLLSAMLANPAEAAGDPLAAYRWKARVLVVVAADAHDPKVTRQKALYEGMRAGADERDLVLVQGFGTGEAAQLLRQRLSLHDLGFHVLLVGKDSGTKLQSDEPLGPDDLFPVIDAMPMRQGEMHSAK